MSLPFVDKKSNMVREISWKKGQLRPRRLRPVNLFIGVWLMASFTLLAFWKSITLNYGEQDLKDVPDKLVGDPGYTKLPNSQSEQTPSPIADSKVDGGALLSKTTTIDTAIDVPGTGPLPSAKMLLTKKPPFEDSAVIKLQASGGGELIQSPNTVVTGYFRVPSKYEPGKYDNWMKNMLSLHDPMVIFTHTELVDQIKDLRQHALDRTIVIPLALEDLPIGSLYPTSFWEDQLNRDPEKKIHRSYYLFWIWLSKSWCVMQAIRLNPFKSDLFVWSDIGCFRNKKYNNKMMIQHRENVPPHEIIQMAHHPPNPPKEELFNDKYKHKANFYHSGSQLAGYKDTWVTFHEKFLETIDRFLKNNMIIVEDQAVLQSTCLSYPMLCAYIPTDQVNDNNYFGLRYVLHNKGKFEYWRHPRASQGEGG